LADFATYRLVLQKMAIFCVSHKIYIADRAFFDPIFSFWYKPSKVKNRKNGFCEKRDFLKSEIRLFSALRHFFTKNRKSEFFVYFSKSSSNVAASEIQNLKNSLNFSKMQKIATKNSRLFLVRSASFFQKQRFSRKNGSFFDEILEKLGSKL
jgi:hypothetical protein